jgi:uncharacterized membrane protein YebE (DUF533 family)
MNDDDHREHVAAIRRGTRRVERRERAYRKQLREALHILDDLADRIEALLEGDDR